MKKKFDMNAAVNIVMNYADINTGIYDLTAGRAGDLYEIAFRTDYLSYEAYVDAASAEVVGFSFEPVGAEPAEDGKIAA